MHGFFLLQLLNLSLLLFSLELSHLSLLFGFGLFRIESGLLSSLLLGSEGSSLLFFLLFSVINCIITVFRGIIEEIIVIILILSNHFVLKHCLESFNSGGEEIRHFLDSESCNVCAILNALNCELLEFKHIIVLILQLIQVHSCIFNTPCNFLLRLLNLGLVSLVQDLEELWINLEVIFTDLEMFISSCTLLYNLRKLVSESSNLGPDLLLLLFGKTHSVVFLCSELRLLN